MCLLASPGEFLKVRGRWVVRDQSLLGLPSVDRERAQLPTQPYTGQTGLYQILSSVMPHRALLQNGVIFVAFFYLSKVSI